MYIEACTNVELVGVFISFVITTTCIVHNVCAIPGLMKTFRIKRHIMVDVDSILSEDISMIIIGIVRTCSEMPKKAKRKADSNNGQTPSSLQHASYDHFLRQLALAPKCTYRIELENAAVVSLRAKLPREIDFKEAFKGRLVELLSNWIVDRASSMEVLTNSGTKSVVSGERSPLF